MKKLMTLMLGAALAFTTVAVSFAQETPKKEDTKKEKKGKKGKKKEGEEEKKGGQ
jgi:ribosomal protein L12E/L44/L45/RPP1/RPP2